MGASHLSFKTLHDVPEINISKFGVKIGIESKF